MAIDRKFDDYAHWNSGGSIAHWPAKRLSKLADEVTRLNMDAYANPRHPQHELVSQEIADLHARAAAATPESERPL